MATIIVIPRRQYEQDRNLLERLNNIIPPPEYYKFGPLPAKSEKNYGDGFPTCIVPNQVDGEWFDLFTQIDNLIHALYEKVIYHRYTTTIPDPEIIPSSIPPHNTPPPPILLFSRWRHLFTNYLNLSVPTLVNILFNLLDRIVFYETCISRRRRQHKYSLSLVWLEIKNYWFKVILDQYGFELTTKKFLTICKPYVMVQYFFLHHFANQPQYSPRNDSPNIFVCVNREKFAEIPVPELENYKMKTDNCYWNYMRQKYIPIWKRTVTIYSAIITNKKSNEENKNIYFEFDDETFHLITLREEKTIYHDRSQHDKTEFVTTDICLSPEKYAFGRCFRQQHEEKRQETTTFDTFEFPECKYNSISYFLFTNNNCEARNIYFLLLETFEKQRTCHYFSSSNFTDFSNCIDAINNFVSKLASVLCLNIVNAWLYFKQMVYYHTLLFQCTNTKNTFFVWNKPFGIPHIHGKSWGCTCNGITYEDYIAFTEPFAIWEYTFLKTKFWTMIPSPHSCLVTIKLATSREIDDDNDDDFSSLFICERKNPISGWILETQIRRAKINAAAAAVAATATAATAAAAATTTIVTPYFLLLVNDKYYTEQEKEKTGSPAFILRSKIHPENIVLFPRQRTIQASDFFQRLVLHEPNAIELDSMFFQFNNNVLETVAKYFYTGFLVIDKSNAAQVFAIADYYVFNDILDCNICKIFKI